MSCTGDGIAEVAAVDFRNGHGVVSFHEAEEETGHNLVGVGATEVDVAARMAAQTVAHIHQEVVEIFGSH